MSRDSKTRAAGATHDSFYRAGLMPALLALATAFLLLCHGMARAENFTPPPHDTKQAPTSIAAPQASGCGGDDMDFSPEENLPSPFDADAVAFHQLRTPPAGLHPAADNSCRDTVQRPQQT